MDKTSMAPCSHSSQGHSRLGNSRLLLLKCRTLYFLIGLSVGVFNPYISILLKHDGVSDSSVGMLMSAGMLVAMIVQPAWGMVADKFGRTRTILAVMFVAPVFFLILFNSRIVFILFLVNMLYFFVKTPQSSISDAYTLHATAKLGPVYGKIRYFQSIGFGIGGYVSGYFLGRFAVTDLWMLVAFVSLIGAVVVIWLPKAERSERSLVKGELYKNVKLLISWQNKNFLVFLFGACLMNQTLAAFNTYLVIAYGDFGGHMKDIGWAFLIASAANIPSMIFARHLISKFGIVQTLMIASSLYLVRWVVQLFVADPLWVIVIQVLHGSFGLFYVPAVHYVLEKSSDHIRATAQTIFGMVAGGLSGIVGNVLNGFLIQTGGPTLMYGICAISSFMAIICFTYIAISDRHKAQAQVQQTTVPM